MDYVFCVRSVRSGEFSNEPGATHFLAVPENSGRTEPGQAIRKRDWVAAVLEEASSGDHPGEAKGDIVFYVHGFNNSRQVMLERPVWREMVSRGL
jgi:hypothetical protein